MGNSFQKDICLFQNQDSVNYVAWDLNASIIIVHPSLKYPLMHYVVWYQPSLETAPNVELAFAVWKEARLMYDLLAAFFSCCETRLLGEIFCCSISCSMWEVSLYMKQKCLLFLLDESLGVVELYQSFSPTAQMVLTVAE